MVGVVELGNVRSLSKADSKLEEYLEVLERNTYRY